MDYDVDKCRSLAARSPSSNHIVTGVRDFAAPVNSSPYRAVSLITVPQIYLN